MLGASGIFFSGSKTGCWSSDSTYLLLLWKHNVLGNWNWCNHHPTKSLQEYSNLNHKGDVYQQKMGTYNTRENSTWIQNFAIYTIFHPYYCASMVMISKLHPKLVANRQPHHFQWVPPQHSNHAYYIKQIIENIIVNWHILLRATNSLKQIIKI